MEHADGSGKPYSTFEIDLTEASDGAVTGSYCFITQGGNRVDCSTDGEKNIAGHVDESGQHATVSFYSFFGAKGGVANLWSIDDELTWKVTNSPNGDFFYSPYAVTLTRKQPDTHRGERQVVVDKAYLYPTPSEASVKMYVIKMGLCKINQRFR